MSNAQLKLVKSGSGEPLGAHLVTYMDAGTLRIRLCSWPPAADIPGHIALSRARIGDLWAVEFDPEPDSTKTTRRIGGIMDTGQHEDGKIIFDVLVHIRHGLTVNLHVAADSFLQALDIAREVVGV